MAGAEVPDNAKGKEKYSGGNRGQRYQRDVNDAVNLLAAAAMLAVLEVAFIVAAHLHRQARDVIAPSRQNFAYDWIDAQLTHGDTDLSRRLSPTTGGWALTPRTGLPTAPGSGTDRPARPAPFPPLSELSLGYCSAQKDAPAPQTLHYYHNRL